MAEQRTIPDLITAADLPPLDEPAATAEQLVLLAHRCVDWDVWGGGRLRHYWPGLTARLRSTALAAGDLPGWWQDLTRRMSLQQPWGHDARLLTVLLAHGDPGGVLGTIVDHREALVTRARLVVEAKRAAYEQAKTVDQEELPL